MANNNLAQKLAEEAAKKMKKKVMKTIMGVLGSILPILLVVFILFGGVILAISVIGDVLGGKDASSGAWFGTVHDDTSEEDKMLTALNNGTITDVELLDLDISREDMKLILETAKEHNSDKFQTVKYQVEYEEWIEKKEADPNSEDPDNPSYIYTYEWQDKSADHSEEMTYHSLDVERNYRLSWSDIYAMYRIGALSNDDASPDADKGKWKESKNENGSLKAITSRIDKERFQKVIDAFTYVHNYIYDPAREPAPGVLSYDDMDKYCFTYEDSGNSPSTVTGDAWPWNTESHNWGNPPTGSEYRKRYRWRKKIPYAVVASIYNDKGVEYIGPNKYEKAESINSGIYSTVGVAGVCATLDKLDNWVVTGRTQTINANVFDTWATSISEAFTMDYFVDSLEIMDSASLDRWQMVKELYNRYKNISANKLNEKEVISGNNGNVTTIYNTGTIVVDNVTYFLREGLKEDGELKKVYIGHSAKNFDQATGTAVIVEDSGLKNDGDWNGYSPIAVNNSDARNYFYWNMKNANGRAAALAAMGNIEYEGGFDNLMRREKNKAVTTEPKAGTGGWGMCQWTGGRADSLTALAHSMKKPWYTIEVQTAMVLNEWTPSMFATNNHGKYFHLKEALNTYGLNDTYHGFSEFNADRDTTDKKTQTKMTLYVWHGWERPAYKDNTWQRRVNASISYGNNYTVDWAPATGGEATP